MMFYVVTGGSGSGKSEYAEQLICEIGKNEARYYIATMQANDAESRRRIKRHRSMRADKRFVTIECYRNLQKLSVTEKGVVLLECMSNLVANEMFAADTADAEAADRAAQAEDKILRGIKNIKKQAMHLVVVTNEIFSDGVHYDPWTRAYQKCLAAVNNKMAGQADHVIEVVYGQVCTLK